jgi:hypothetical protein
VSALKTTNGAAAAEAAEEQEDTEFATKSMVDKPLDLSDEERWFLEDLSPWGSANSSSRMVGWLGGFVR